MSQNNQPVSNTEALSVKQPLDDTKPEPAVDVMPLVNTNMNYFEIQEQAIKKKNTETKKRQYLSYIVTGKVISEENVINQINEHQAKVKN